jgi:hypothetical protein
MRGRGFWLVEAKQKSGAYSDIRVSYQGEALGTVRVLTKSGAAEYESSGGGSWDPRHARIVADALSKTLMAYTPNPGNFPKRCGCGRVYTSRTWAKLPYVGVIDVPEDATGPHLITELRNCPCKSTIAIDVSPKKKGNPRPTPTQINAGKLRYRIEHWGKGGTEKPRQLSCANPFDPKSGPVVTIGRLVALEYETDKLGDGMNIYRHEVTSRDATIASVKNGRLVIGGEKIRMTLRGIVG